MDASSEFVSALNGKSPPTRSQGLSVPSQSVQDALLRQAAALPPVGVRAASSLPASYDARTSWGSCRAFRVLNQGGCGSCWAFAAATALSARMCIRTQRMFDEVLAPQDYLSCQYSTGCRGGWPMTAYLDQRRERRGFRVVDSCDRYSGRDASQGDTCGSHCNANGYEFGATQVMSTDSVPRGVQHAQTRLRHIKEAIYAGGPVVVAIAAGNPGFSGYRGGIMTGDNSARIDHAVVAVGWGNEGGREYLIIQNSWGSSWGENGFARVDVNAKNILQHATWATPVYAHADPFRCDSSVNFIQGGASYQQVSLTDHCPNCDANPLYGPNNVERAKAYCKRLCLRDRPGCRGFFFQRHRNGHEICGFYHGDMSAGQRVAHSHLAGAVCQL